jgi:hypothetical protein
MKIIIRNLVWFPPNLKLLETTLPNLYYQLRRHLVSWKADTRSEITFAPLYNYMSFIMLFPHLLINALAACKKLKLLCLCLAG